MSSGPSPAASPLPGRVLPFEAAMADDIRSVKIEPRTVYDPKTGKMVRVEGVATIKVTAAK